MYFGNICTKNTFVLADMLVVSFSVNGVLIMLLFLIGYISSDVIRDGVGFRQVLRGGWKSNDCSSSSSALSKS